MELTIKQTAITKGVAILMMLCLHLFNRDFQQLFAPIIFIGYQPLTYYVSLYCDCCVAIYCFCSGYGLYCGFVNNKSDYGAKNKSRIIKMYVNYWIIFILMVVGLGFAVNGSFAYLGTATKFILDFFAINNAYCGAWWFFFIYILLVASSPFLFKMIIRFPFYIILLSSFVIYTFAYIQRIFMPLHFSNAILNLTIEKIALYGNSLFPFLIGAVSLKQQWFSKFNIFFNRIRYKNQLLIALLLTSVVAHCFVPSLFVAVFTGVFFIFCFNAINLPQIIDDFLLFISKHSTNIWLTHMFFYATYFESIVYAPKYPLLIYLWLLLWCLLASYAINFIYTPLVNWLSIKLKL